ncbi:PucR family transcriptional regulator [Maledivibacter halophilus]|uniref:Sugar diacid utilization regulator n=1 Tax=Maledivibacter halophilus TaxID=36842 RepID=A0A1T5L2L6_9FIRM|nr:PucR family transcriptional regulator [Maledivibacter halophilus]SKC70267.1 Sugar diacid utilization regulator [Maledivibacter halophilus]
MILTVKDLFNLNRNLSEIKVLAGFNGLDRQITNVQVMEAPDGVYWVKEGELLISTGFGFRNTPEEISEALKILIENKAAGLVIKIGRFIKKIPQRALDIAEKSNFPLLEFPVKLGYRDITHPIMEKLMNQENYEFKMLDQLRSSLLQTCYNKNNIEDTLAVISCYTNNSIVIFDSYFNILKYNISEKNREDLSIIFKISNYIKMDYKKLINNSSSIKINDNFYNFIIFPLINADEIIGYLCTFSLHEINKLDKLVLNQSVPYVIISLLSKKKNRQDSLLIRNDFFKNLILGNYVSKSIIKSGIDYFNLEENLNRMIMIVYIENSTCKIDYQAYKNKLLTYINNNPMPNSYEEIIFNNNEGIFLLNLEKDLDISNIQANYSKWSDDFLKSFKFLYKRISILIGFGDIYDNLEKVNKSYKEAILSIKLGPKIMKDKSFIYHYNDFKLYHILFEFRNHPLLENIFEGSAKKLIDYDKSNNAQLIKTLALFYQNNSNVQKTAKDLFIHRNTLYSRLKKISLLTAIDPTSSEGSLLLQLSLKLMDIYELYKNK